MPAAFVNVPLIAVAKVPRAPTAAKDSRTRSNAYSVKSWPCSSLHNFIRRFRIQTLLFDWIVSHRSEQCAFTQESGNGTNGSRVPGTEGTKGLRVSVPNGTRTARAHQPGRPRDAKIRAATRACGNRRKAPTTAVSDRQDLTGRARSQKPRKRQCRSRHRAITRFPEPY